MLELLPGEEGLHQGHAQTLGTVPSPAKVVVDPLAQHFDELLTVFESPMTSRHDLPRPGGRAGFHEITKTPRGMRHNQSWATRLADSSMATRLLPEEVSILTNSRTCGLSRASSLK